MADGLDHSVLHPLLQSWEGLGKGVEDLRSVLLNVSACGETTLLEVWRESIVAQDAQELIDMLGDTPRDESHWWRFSSGQRLGGPLFVSEYHCTLNGTGNHTQDLYGRVRFESPRQHQTVSNRILGNL